MLDKEELEKYMTDRYDVTIDQLSRHFHVKDTQDIEELNHLLSELEKEGMVIKAHCEVHDVIEYDCYKKGDKA